MHPVTQTARRGQRAERNDWSHNLHVSPATIHHTEAAFSIVWRIYGREHDDVGRFGREYGYLVHISACHSSSSRTHQITNAKAHDFSDSVLCGKMGDGAKINGRRKTTSRI